jgi:hypothetical protein
MERSRIIILVLACIAVCVPSASADSTRPADTNYCIVYEADVPVSDTTPVDPTIEEPLRPIHGVSSEILFDEGAARCGPLGPVPLGMGLLFALAMAVRFVNRPGPAVACERRKEHGTPRPGCGNGAASWAGF